MSFSGAGPRSKTPGATQERTHGKRLGPVPRARSPTRVPESGLCYFSASFFISPDGSREGPASGRSSCGLETHP